MFEAVKHEWWKASIVFYFGEHPDAHSELSKLLPALADEHGPGLFNAAAAIGLALQACYLSKVAEKQTTLAWVVHALARAQSAYLSFVEEDGVKFPLNAFLMYYLRARDSVATDMILPLMRELQSEYESTDHPKDREVELFWSLVGAVESGHVEEAELLITKFKPDDDRLLLALFMGSFFIANLRISKKSEKIAAERICEDLAPKTEDRRKQIRDELKGILLELRREKMKVLDAPATGAAPAEEIDTDEL